MTRLSQIGDGMMGCQFVTMPFLCKRLLATRRVGALWDSECSPAHGFSQVAGKLIVPGYVKAQAQP